jgi:hypothetical protein
LKFNRSVKAVDRNGYESFRGNEDVKGALRAPRSGFALDILIASEKTLAVAIDGTLALLAFSATRPAISKTDSHSHLSPVRRGRLLSGAKKSGEGGPPLQVCSVRSPSPANHSASQTRVDALMVRDLSPPGRGEVAEVKRSRK